MVFLVKEEDSDGRSEFKHQRFGQFTVNDAYLDAIHGAVKQRDLSSQNSTRSMPFSRLQPGQTPPSIGIWYHNDSLLHQGHGIIMPEQLNRFKPQHTPFCIFGFDTSSPFF